MAAAAADGRLEPVERSEVRSCSEGKQSSVRSVLLAYHLLVVDPADPDEIAPEAAAAAVVVACNLESHSSLKI